MFIQRRSVSLKIGKYDPLELERNLNTQLVICIFGHLFIHQVFIDDLAGAAHDVARIKVTETQGGLVVCSVTASY